MRSLTSGASRPGSLRQSLARAVAVLLVGCVTLVTAGCAEGGVEPGVWAGRVCQALGPWTEQIGTLTEDAQQQMSEAESPKQAKQAIVGLLRGAEQASQDARDGVVAAGVPAVDNGEKIAQKFRAALRGARDSYRKARRAIDKLKVDDVEEFYDGTVEVMDTLNKNYRGSSLDTENLSSEELQQAFDESPDCQ